MAEDIQGAILRALEGLTCLHTGEVAEEAGISRSAAYHHLHRLEREGMVKGSKHDERGLFHGGRVRLYWSLDPEGGPDNE